MSGAAAGGGSSCLGAAAAASCSSAGASYAAAAGGGAGVAGRLPGRVLEHIFSYLDLADLMRCSLVCWHWNNILADENSEVWRSLSTRTLSEEALRSDILCNLPTYKGKVGLPRYPLIPAVLALTIKTAYLHPNNVPVVCSLSIHQLPSSKTRPKMLNESLGSTLLFGMHPIHRPAFMSTQVQLQELVLSLYSR